MAVDPICGMQVDEKKSLKLSWQGKDYFFCSERCRQKFIQQNKITEPCPSCAVPVPGTPWWQNKIVLLAFVYAIIIVAGLLNRSVAPLKDSLLMYVGTIAWPILIGLLIGGVIDWLVPGEYISSLLARKKKRTIVYAVMTGFLMSACSHGILALAIQLHKKGASPPAVVAFLLASPWANLPLTILMFGFFGLKAFVIVLGAIVIALITGYIFMFLESRSLIERNANTIALGEDFSIWQDARRRLAKVQFQPLAAVRGITGGMISLGNMVLWWIMFGMLLASVAATYIPAGFMHHYMGPTLLGLLVTLFLATIIEICSEGSAPLAFELYRQTGALGNSFVFLMAGVVTDYTEIGLIWQNIGWRTAVWLPVIAVPQVMVLAVLINYFF
ncbi:MAG: permease [Candidatus Margulisiibacteriota bacterium]